MIDIASKVDGGPVSPEQSAKTSEVIASGGVAIPLQELQVQKSTIQDKDTVLQPVNTTPASPDLPPIDKRGFLTLLAQHVSRYALSIAINPLWPRLMTCTSVPGTLEAANLLSTSS